MKRVYYLVIVMLTCTRGIGQDSSQLDKPATLPGKLFAALDRKTRCIETTLEKQTRLYLSKLQKQEHKLKRKLSKKDTLLAAQIFGDIDKNYKDLSKPGGNIDKAFVLYSCHLDSLFTALLFLKNNTLAKLSFGPSVQNTLSQLQHFQSRLNASDQIKNYLKQRQIILNERLQSPGMIRELKQFSKQVYYYEAQLRECRKLFEEPSALEQRLLALVMNHPGFKEFFADQSMLSMLFAVPGSASSFAHGRALGALQTRQLFNQSINDRFGSGSDLAAQLQQNFQSAQEQLTELKNKAGLLSAGSFGNSGETALPNFKPNDQKTKSFFKRLEYGVNIQSQNARYFFPVTSDIGLSLGYKLNDKSSIGIGASYKLGWGAGWNNLSITHQGIGLRSYVDWKFKGLFYISGGYEQNYRSMIRDIEQLKYQSAWQRSGLLGLSKKYMVSKKLKGEMRLLWDFLSYQQLPITQPLVFRIGYNLK